MFDVHQSITDKYGEHDEDRIEGYIDGLLDEFAASPEGKQLLDAGEDVHDAGMMMEYGINYIGVTPTKMSLRDFNEVVFELIPKKVSTEPENGPRIITVLRAFWSFLKRQYALPNAMRILASLDDKAGQRLQETLANPANWGMAKSFVMQGMAADYDMTTQEGTDAFMLEYNRRLLEAGLPPPLPLDPAAIDLLSLELPNQPSHKARADKRKERKRQRQARKRNRRK
jgi:hypothetical protein